MVEVLVAMAILLVGIWALAVGFPKLLGVIALEEKRTEMARQALRTLDQLKRETRKREDEEGKPTLPLAIRGDSFNTSPETVDANLFPADPDIADFGITPANSRDDMIEIIGERFTVPAPVAPPYGPYPVYVFRQGLAASVQAVYEEVPLPPAPAFDVAGNGTVTFGIAAFVEINYDWVDTVGTTHHVYGEFIDAGVTSEVAAAALIGTFSQVLPGTVDGIQLIQLFPPAVSLHSSGAFLLFHEGAVGAGMRVNYTLLRCEPPPYAAPPDPAARRALIMSEDHRIVSIPQTITLVSSHIDDQQGLPIDADGDGTPYDTTILAVDLNTGYVYWEGSGLDWLEEDAASKGEITVGDSSPAPEIGHDVRFYYVTLDQDLITVQIAPQTFMDWNVVDAAGQYWLLYRSYFATPNYYHTDYTDLLFYPCNAGHTVTVSYDYNEGGNIFTATSEMHTISTDKGYNEDYPELHTITLLYPNVEEIVAVTGVSLKARAWWRAPNGRLEKLDVSTVR